MGRRALASLLALFTCSAAMAAETITYRYDARGRLLRVERSGTVNNGVVTTYCHDRANNRLSKTKTP
jgi:YD repeat-containing protein